MKVTIKHRSFIPADIVQYPVSPVPASLRHSFNGGTKGDIVCAIDLDVAGPASFSLTSALWHESIEYDIASTEAVPSQPDWVHRLKPSPRILGRATLSRTASNLNAVWTVPTQGTHAVFLMHNGGNPLLTAAPNIDAAITLSLRTRGGQVEYHISGEHDGFPAYEIELNGRVVWAYDPIAADEDPSDLASPMDHQVTIDWKAL